MAKPTKADSTLRAQELLRLNSSPTWVQSRLAGEGINLSTHHIQQIRRRAGLGRVNVDASEYLPWKLRPVHRNYYVPMKLRYLANRHAGAKLPARQSSQLDAWLEALTDADEVIDYQPNNCETCEGDCKLSEAERIGSEHKLKPFPRVARRKAKNKWGDDEFIDPPWIRDPSVADDGSKIDNWITPGGAR